MRWRARRAVAGGVSMSGMDSRGRLHGKAAIITGGEGSIGMATARAFAAEGARVCLVGLVEDELRAGAAELGEAAIWTLADVTSSVQVKTAVARAAETFGRLDVVVSNAGISGVIAPVADYPEEVFDQVLAVHVRGTFLVCKHSLPYLKAGASVVITSSVVGLTSAAGICAYATAKHALVGLMRTLAKETAPHGIRVNTIHPGPVDNDFQHSHRGRRHRRRPGPGRLDLRAAHPAGQARQPGGGGPGHAVPGQRRELVRDRRHAGRRRRHVDLSSPDARPAGGGCTARRLTSSATAAGTVLRRPPTPPHAGSPDGGNCPTRVKPAAMSPAPD